MPPLQPAGGSGKPLLRTLLELAPRAIAAALAVGAAAVALPHGRSGAAEQPAAEPARLSLASLRSVGAAAAGLAAHLARSYSLDSLRRNGVAVPLLKSPQA